MDGCVVWWDVSKNVCTVCVDTVYCSVGRGTWCKGLLFGFLLLDSGLVWSGLVCLRFHRRASEVVVVMMVGVVGSALSLMLWLIVRYCKIQIDRIPFFLYICM